MRRLTTHPTAFSLLAGWLLAAPLVAQPEQLDAETAAIVKAMTPGSQHTYLAGQAGSWKVTLWSWTDPDAPPVQGAGTVEREMILGGRVLQESITAEIMGMSYDAVGHVGYDNVTGKYWTTSFDNLSTGVTTLTGTIDESTSAGTLVGETPDAMAGRVPMRLEIYQEDGKQVMDTYMTIAGEEVLKIKVVYQRQ